MEKCYSVIGHGALNDLLDWAKSKGFQTSLKFDLVTAYNDLQSTLVYDNNEILIKEICEFLDTLVKVGDRFDETSIGNNTNSITKKIEI